jgi:hypothetical protein
VDFKHGKGLTSSLREAIKNTRIDVAVAFWGRDAFDLLNLKRARAGSRIICDAYSGACNPAAIKALLDADFEVYDQPGLHAKVYICDEVLIVGSANASANGLGEEDGEIAVGLEAALWTTEEAPVSDAKVWFERHVGSANRLSFQHLPRINELWEKRRIGRPLRQEMTLEAAITSQHNILSDRRFSAYIYNPVELPDEVEERYKETIHYKSDEYDRECLPFFWDACEWQSKTDDLILSFEVQGQKVKFDGMSRVVGSIDGGLIVPVMPEYRPLGLRFTDGQGRSFAKRVRDLIKRGHIAPSGELIPIAEFAALFGEKTG